MTRRSVATALAISMLLQVLEPAAGDERRSTAFSPGIGPVDRRVAVDAQSPPWNAIAKVQTNITTRCSGTLIAPSTVLTAAHCLYNRRTRRFLQPGSLHVLFGYQRGVYRWHGRVVSCAIGGDFDGGEPGRHPGSDWARLELAAQAPSEIAPIFVANGFAAPGTPIAQLGYSQDRAEILTGDFSCRIAGLAHFRGALLLMHDCAASRGTSGGPLLTERDGRWEVVGINIAIADGARLALPASSFASDR